ncbi:MAG: metal-dependent transcriptional regulator [Dehalococcoidales bacterium]|nr:metal-dependent transcriptional regulator [Dehalococcoidales bacterium]
MELGEKAEEVLETLWVLTEEIRKTDISPADLTEADKESIDQLIEAGYISLTDSGVKLTDLGRPLARDVVRRHRLAERLLTDVLGTGDSLIHEKACKFEHILDRGLDESICSLLGHPKVCPHGKPIPPGNCCRQAGKQGQRVVSALSQLTPGQVGKVAYIHTNEPGQLQKLTAMGILPGAPVRLLQDFPSYVFQIRQTQFAVDKEIADSIYVRLVETETTVAPEGEIQRRHWWLMAKR